MILTHACDVDVTNTALNRHLSHVLNTFFFIFAGLPAVMVALSLSIAAGKGGIQTFVSDK